MSICIRLTASIKFSCNVQCCRLYQTGTAEANNCWPAAPCAGPSHASPCSAPLFLPACLHHHPWLTALNQRPAGGHLPEPQQQLLLPHAGLPSLCVSHQHSRHNTISIWILLWFWRLIQRSKLQVSSCMRAALWTSNAVQVPRCLSCSLHVLPLHSCADILVSRRIPQSSRLQSAGNESASGE